MVPSIVFACRPPIGGKVKPIEANHWMAPCVDWGAKYVIGGNVEGNICGGTRGEFRDFLEASKIRT